MKHNIINIEEKDLKQIVEIAEQSDLAKWMKNDYANEIKKENSITKSFLINDDNQSLITEHIIAGFIIARLIKSQSIASHSSNSKIIENNIENENECEILQLAVRREARRQGIARSLLTSIVAECQRENVKRIWLEVRKNNEEALKFYLSNGFETIYTRKNYYQNPCDDALVMKLELSSNGMFENS